MNFSVTSTEKNGIIQACERYTRLGDATISAATTTTLVDFTNYANEVSRRVWHIIFKAYGGWQYDDGNQTDLPAATTAVNADQTSYALPSGALTVRGIEVKNTGGVWMRLMPLSEERIRERIAVGEFFKISATPLYYQLVGQTVRIFPAANFTQASSFKVFFDRGSVAFTSTDTTTTPGFASEYHDVIPLGASAMWYKLNSPQDPTAQAIISDYEQKIIDITDFYQTKFSQMFPPRMFTRDMLRDAQ